MNEKNRLSDAVLMRFTALGGHHSVLERSLSEAKQSTIRLRATALQVQRQVPIAPVK